MNGLSMLVFRKVVQIERRGGDYHNQINCFCGCELMKLAGSCLFDLLVNGRNMTDEANVE